MATKRRNGMNEVGDMAKDVASSVQQTKLVDRLIRVGYLTRGIVYGLVGFLAIQTVMNGRGKITDQKGALASLAAQPFGKWVLIVVAIGLIGLFLWGVIRAVADPMHKGSDMKGMAERAGYLVSGIAYASLFVPTVNLIRGSGGGAIPSTGQSVQSTAAGIMGQPWGPILIGLIGAILFVVGAVRIWDGYRAKFHERFKSYQMNAEQRKWAVRLGRFGYVALGLVFVIIGFLAVLAATTKNPARVSGLDGALLFLVQQPYGPWLLGLVALGLIAYAIYSFLGAFWFRIRTHA